jgi:hypothetical protein
MTRIEVGAAKLRRLIRAHDPTWLKRAREQTKTLETGIPATEFPSIWNEIKDVYIRLQGGERGSKCAYCEKWIEAARIEHDVEHFRPKTKVSRWKVPEHLLREFHAAGVQVNQPAEESELGYRFLAYHVLNYAAACKQCNSVLKRNLFPITGKRLSNAKDPARLKSEGALLIYPIDHVDTDPEDLIEFQGISPRAKAAAGLDRLRALVTIEIFQLDDWRSRKSLIYDRLEWVEKLWLALKQRDRGESPNDVHDANQTIARMISTGFRHANCLRSFHRLYERSPGEAEGFYKVAMKYLQSYSSGKGPSSTEPIGAPRRMSNR